jgi:serine/threonine-protein kinase HipA
VVKAYERAVFNVLFNNRDDHCKNFAFRLGRDRQWRLAPGYDITFNAGPGGEHQMDVCGEARRITRAHMVRLAEKGGIKERVAAASLDRVLVEVAPFEKRLRAQPIRATTIRKIIGHVRDNQAALRR